MDNISLADEATAERIRTAEDHAPPRRRWRTVGALAVLVVVLGIAGEHYWPGGAKPAAPPPPAPQVTVSRPLQKTVQATRQFLGQFSAVDSVELRAQVGGTLTAIQFRDGQIVHKGDPLFVIDPRPYKIELEQALAQLQTAQAKEVLSEAELWRAQQLKRTDFGTAESVDQRDADKRSAEASIQTADAAISNAQLDLEYSRITAPFTGRIGAHLVSVGNLVSGSRGGTSPTTLLATIVSLDPIYLDFDMSESDYAAYQQVHHGTGEPHDGVAISIDGDGDFNRHGTLDFIDNAVNRSSGTIHARATVPNPDLSITPGQFARLRRYAWSAGAGPFGPGLGGGARSIAAHRHDGGAEWHHRAETSRGRRVVRWAACGPQRPCADRSRRYRRSRACAPGRQGYGGNREDHARPPPAAPRNRRDGMRFTHRFIDRPIFATVISVFLTLIGLGALVALPVAQYPEIVPPTVQITTSYPGASAQVVSQTVATPLEQEINGVENMIYMSSQSTGDGKLTITVTFRIGTDLNVAQMLTQNRVQDALPRLPEDVQRLGVQVRKATPNILLAVHLYSPDRSRDDLYLSNYATLHVKDALARLPGVGDVQLFGSRDYAMRIWLDPDKVAAYKLDADEVLAALRAQNVQVSAGILNQPPVAGTPAYQLNVQTLGRLTTPEQFADIILKTDAQGRPTRIRDVGRVEIGAADYGSTAYMDRSDGLPLLIFAQPGANSLAVEHEVLSTMQTLKKNFPPGVSDIVIYDPTIFVAKSVHEVVTTIFVAILLVVGVVFLFLQTWRASLIPVIAIPVSLVGTFIALFILGISLNNLSLFGLVLAVGIVVDDAIVVVENVERNISAGMMPKEAAHRTMDEVGGALVSIALTLCAVFVPSAFLSGISGQFFRQFAITIAASTVISCFVSLTLSPALCAILLKPHSHKPRRRNLAARVVGGFFRGFNSAFEWLSDALRIADPPACARPGCCRGDLCCPDRRRRFRILAHADRLHTRAGPGVFDNRAAAPAGRQPAAHRSGGEARGRYHPEDAWR